MKVLPQHKDLEDWRGREDADIMYRDRTGEMEKFLRKYSFSKFPEWSDLRSDDEESKNTSLDEKSENTSEDEDDGKSHKEDVSDQRDIENNPDTN